MKEINEGILRKNLEDKLVEFAKKYKEISRIAKSSYKRPDYYFLITPPYSFLVDEIKKFNQDLIKNGYECNLFDCPDSINIFELPFIGKVFWKRN